jgi:FkbM family methyltransferase
MTLDLREGIQRGMFLGAYEPTETKWLRQCITLGDTFIDVGANFGHYTTLAAALVGPAGTVFAFEPSPLASGVLEEAILSSELANVVLTKAAVGKENASVPLFLPTGRSLHSPSILRSDPGFLEVQVPVVALDCFEPLKQNPQVKLMKVDVEGYEPDVLAGAEHMIKAGRVENIFCEFNSWWLGQNSTTPKQLLERFFDLGYKIHKQTELQENLAGHQGATFNLQDIWFQLT